MKAFQTGELEGGISRDMNSLKDQEDYRTANKVQKYF